MGEIRDFLGKALHQAQLGYRDVPQPDTLIEPSPKKRGFSCNINGEIKDSVGKALHQGTTRILWHTPARHSHRAQS